MKFTGVGPFAKTHARSLGSGALLGLAIVAGLSRVLFNFAPFYSEKSSAWSAPISLSARTAQGLYQPRVDEWLRRVRENGRSGGAVWQSLREATQAWLRADPIGCLNHLHQTGASSLIDDGMLDEALEAVTAGQFSVAIARCDEIESAPLRSRWITRAFQKEADLHPESALLALPSIPVGLRFRLGIELARQWAARDPRTAVQAALIHNRGLLSSMTWFWADQDPDAAFRFFAEQPEPLDWQAGPTISPQRVIQMIARNHPQKALALLRGMPENENHTFTTRGALQIIAGKDPRLALDMARGLPGDLERLQALSFIAGKIADPAVAAEIRQSLPGERTQTLADARSIWSGGYEKPAESAQKAEALSNPIARSDAMHSAAEVWLSKQPAAMLEFATQPGNSTWMRVLVDNALDKTEGQNNGAQFAPALLSNLTPETRASLLSEIATRPASDGRQKLLDALQ